MLSKSLRINSAIAIIWWLLFYPGFYSGDSLYFIQIAKSETRSTSVTPLYEIYLKVFSLFGNYIPLLTLVNVLLLTYATTRFFFSLRQDSTSGIGSGLLCGTPLIGAIGITLWQDVPFTSGLLLLASFLITRIKDGGSSVGDLMQLFIPGIICVNFRPNGLIIILLLGFLLVLLFRFRFVKVVATMFVISVTLSLGLPILQGERIVDAVYAQTWMRYDVMCYLAKTNERKINDLSVQFSGDIELWQSEKACSWFAESALSRKKIIASTDFIPNVWRSILIEDPDFLLKIHLNRNAYLIPIPINGLPKPPFIHTVIDRNTYDLAWINEGFTDRLRFVPRIWNFFNFFFAWSGLWWTIIIILFIYRKQKDQLIPLLFSSVTTLVLFVIAPIPDARYSLPILVMGQALLLQSSLEKFLKSKKSK